MLEGRSARAEAGERNESCQEVADIAEKLEAILMVVEEHAGRGKLIDVHRGHLPAGAVNMGQRIRSGCLLGMSSPLLTWSSVRVHKGRHGGSPDSVLFCYGCSPSRSAAARQRWRSSSVSNETGATVHVRSRLRGHADFEDTYDLAPAETRPLIKYEENRSSVSPIAGLVLGLQLVTNAGCVAQLADGSLVRASTRDVARRHWTVHVRSEAMAASSCSPR